MGKHSKPEESATHDSTYPVIEAKDAATSLDGVPAGEIRSATNNWGELDG